MNAVLAHLGQLILQYPSWSYAIIGIAVLLQGELAIFFCMLLIVNGGLGWNEFLIVAPGALLVTETFFYILSRILRNTRFGWKFYKRIKTNRRTQFYMYYLKTNLKKLFIAARFLVATNLIVIVLAGWSRTKFWEFFRAYFFALFLWFVSMTGIAYVLISGLHYLQSERLFQQIEIVIGAVLVLIFTGEYFLRRILRRTAFIEEKAEAIGKIVEEELGPDEKKTE